jgi:hypothetical protein
MIEKIFNGRNGIDVFSIFLIALAWIFMLLPYTIVLSVALIVYALWRSFSKNIPKRRAEQAKFQSCAFAVGRFFTRNTKGIRKYFGYQGLKWKNRKTTVYIQCPKCKNKLSLPRHKGKLAVTCTVCRHEFIKKT